MATTILCALAMVSLSGNQVRADEATNAAPVVTPVVARAKPAGPQPKDATSVGNVQCFRLGEKATIKLHPDVRTRMEFPEPVLNYDVGKGNYGDDLALPEKLRLTLQPKPNAKSTNLNLSTTNTPTTPYRLETVTKADEATYLVIVQRPDDELDARCPERQRGNVRGETYFGTYPKKTATWKSGGYELVAALSEQHHQDNEFVCEYQIANNGIPYPIGSALLRQRGTKKPFVDSRVSISRGASFPLQLPSDGEIAGLLNISASGGSLKKGFELVLLPLDSTIPPAVFSFDDKPANEGRLSIQVQGVAGTINLENGAGETEFTTLLGVGGRAIYGFSKHLSAEGSISVLSADKEDFASITTARALLGGVLHFGGEKYIPYARVAAGFRLTSYTAATATESDLRGGGLFSVGFGIDIWGGEGFVIGASAQYVGALGESDDPSYSVEAGAHAGFAWKP